MSAEELVRILGGPRRREFTFYGYDWWVYSTPDGLLLSRKGNCWDNAPMESFWGKLNQ